MDTNTNWPVGLRVNHPIRRKEIVIYVHPDLRGAPGLDQLAEQYEIRVWPEELQHQALILGPAAWHFGPAHAKAGLWKLVLQTALRFVKRRPESQLTLAEDAEVQPSELQDPDEDDPTAARD